MADYPTRFTVKGLRDGLCWARSCMWPAEDKGTITVGRGYTSYREIPLAVCHQNSQFGCPNEIPEPDPENVRCCFRPEYRRKLSAPVNWRECSTCGSHAPRRAWGALNGLPTQPGVPCPHGDVASVLRGWSECKSCHGFWDHMPLRYEVSQHTFDEYLVELRDRLTQVSDVSVDTGHPSRG